MVDPGLVNHITHSLKKGEDIEAIKSRLLSAGHNETTVHEAAEQVKSASPEASEQAGKKSSVTTEGSGGRAEHAAHVSAYPSWLTGLFSGRVDLVTWFFGGMVLGLFGSALNTVISTVIIYGYRSLGIPLNVGTGLRWVVGLALGVLGVSLVVRRLHDKGKSGWLWLVSFIPVANLILFIYLLLPADPSPNKYGVRAERAFFNRIFNTQAISSTAGWIAVIISLVIVAFGYYVVYSSYTDYLEGLRHQTLEQDLNR